MKPVGRHTAAGKSGLHRAVVGSQRVEEVSVAKEDRGFASMDRQKQREIASKGGKAAHAKGTAHEWTSEEAREAGRKGGMASHRRRKEMTDVPGGETDSAQESGCEPDATTRASRFASLASPSSRLDVLRPGARVCRAASCFVRATTDTI